MVEYEVLGTIKHKVIQGTETFLEFEDRVIRFKDIQDYNGKVVYVEDKGWLKKKVNKIFGGTVKECFCIKYIEDLDFDRITEHFIKSERDYEYWSVYYNYNDNDNDLRSLEIYGCDIALILSNGKVIKISSCPDGGCDIYLLKE